MYLTLYNKEVNWTKKLNLDIRLSTLSTKSTLCCQEYFVKDYAHLILKWKGLHTHAFSEYLSQRENAMKVTSQ